MRSVLIQQYEPSSYIIQISIGLYYITHNILIKISFTIQINMTENSIFIKLLDIKRIENRKQFLFI